jgi:hypothetical protein
VPGFTECGQSIPLAIAHAPLCRGTGLKEGSEFSERQTGQGETDNQGNVSG